MAPIGVGNRQFGWFVAVNRTTVGRHWAPSPLLQLGHDEFGTWEASLLNTAATLLASHASNLDLIREKERLLINTVRSLVTALDSKDAYTRGHSERVALFSKRVAETLGYDTGAAERLYLSGLLHDVGKIGVSDATLRKPDKLTDEEFAEIMKHPDEGWAILRDLEQLELRAARRAASPRASGRRRLPRRTYRRADSARCAHHGRGRRLRRHDQRPRLPRPACLTIRPSKSSAMAPARSGMRTSWTHSCRSSRTLSKSGTATSRLSVPRGGSRR